jgi:hypothetical protein
MAEEMLALRRHFDGDEGSFLLQLRCELVWDKERFLDLVTVMQRYLETRQNTEHIERWIAEGFWFLSHFVKEWSSHENFPRPHSADYYDRAYGRLHDLSYWCFVGESPYESATLEPFA